MKLLELDEIAEFERILRHEHLPARDFMLTECDTTDPRTDELLPLQGYLTVLCISSGRFQEYAIGDGTAWVRLFYKDVRNQIYAGQRKH